MRIQVNLSDDVVKSLDDCSSSLGASRSALSAVLIYEGLLRLGFIPPVPSDTVAVSTSSVLPSFDLTSREVGVSITPHFVTRYKKPPIL